MRRSESHLIQWFIISPKLTIVIVVHYTKTSVDDNRCAALRRPWQVLQVADFRSECHPNLPFL